ncbi:Pleckstrin likey domain-containing family M member 3 [Senna tora]|uniref:Pleckstrin likey domain-containing family M member 3 n=1 Tax=Senna tora TaxID=362788 RepID=A0A834X5U4_9FABA|nr:Pleckstrin likey domain-containing family M member 3 [Senna tora]
MINGEGTREAASPDPFDSFPTLRVRQSDPSDASHPSSRYSSCGESEFDRYCSANSVMGTPSMCSTITVFNDFSELEFGSTKSFGIGGENGLENFSLGERVEMTPKDQRLSTSSVSDSMRDFRIGFGSENIRNQKNLKYGFSGLELYGDDNDELTMTMLDASSLMAVNQSDEKLEGDKGSENFSLSERVEMNQKDQRLLTSSVSEGMRDFRTGFGSEHIRNRQNLKYGSSGLELYGDDNGELTMTMADSSSLMGVNQSYEYLDQGGKDVVECSEVLKGHDELGGADDYSETMSSDAGDNAGHIETYLLSNVDEKCSQSKITVEGGLSSTVDKEDEFDSFDAQPNLQIDERELENEEDGNSSFCEDSEGEDSMHNYGSDDDKKKDFCLSRSIHHHQESKVQHENPLLINSSVAFGSDDLDDFLLENEENGQVSLMFDLFQSQKQRSPETEKKPRNLGSVSSRVISTSGQKVEGEDRNDQKDLSEPQVQVVRDFPAACCLVQGDDKVTNTRDSSSNASRDFPNMVILHQEDGREIIVAKNKCPKTEVDLDPLAEEVPQDMDLNVSNSNGGITEKANECMNKEAIVTSDVQLVENPEFDKSKFKFDHSSDSTVEPELSSLTKQLGNTNEESFENLDRVGHISNYGLRKTLESSSNATNLVEKSPMTSQIENFELNEFYDEIVHEMEEILLDSFDSPGTRIAQGSRFLEPQFSLPLRDGGLTASTSGTDDAYLLVQHPMRIDKIEVVGARQKKGDVSFSERLVGVKEYTVYKIKVWSNKDQWEVERRYRDFLTLHRRLKALFTEQEWVLPLPWSSVGKESTKIFGSASPDVIAQRSLLIQDCLQSILHTRFFSSPPSALIWFLSPQDSYPSSPASNTLASQSPFTSGTNNGNLSTLGKTISLIVDIPPNKSMKQLLEAQYNTCAGCHKHFDDGKTLIMDLVETFGWGKPRICEYTGQLFCSSCHTNETAVLPARVLHQWDFTKYPVSQLAKSYLDSIHDQPMLCVTAVNPFLLSKVPALLHVMSVRKKIRTVLPFVRCPFRRSINRGLGTRRYLVESNDFFSLRDLIDLSRGAFAVSYEMVLLHFDGPSGLKVYSRRQKGQWAARAELEMTHLYLILTVAELVEGWKSVHKAGSALPVMVETLSSKILEHITDQCLICCDVGVPCNARQDCSDPSSLIFPFQEDEIEKCKTCQSVFHKRCFRKVSSCPCGVHLRSDETMSLTNRVNQRREIGETRGTLDLLGRGLGSGFLSGLFTKEKPQKSKEHKDENIILMGSLPSTSL